jgi:hypothetical protein
VDHSQSVSLKRICQSDKTNEMVTQINFQTNFKFLELHQGYLSGEPDEMPKMFD